MVLTTNVLVLRNLRMSQAAAFFKEMKATNVVNDLNAVIKKGDQIISLLNRRYQPNQSLVNFLTANFLGRIKSYLQEGQCALEMAALIIKSEEEELDEILCDLKDEGSLLIMHLRHGINSPQLVKK